ncbi:MAG: hypothetical protein RLZZ157_1720 [Pseudomonadota bacterium]|jgi:hypothetical protein
MASLTGRNLLDNSHQSLRVRAAANGRSMEAEVRMTLAKSVNDNTHVNTSQKPDQVDWAEIQARARTILMAANGGVMPENVVDEWLAEKRTIAAREQSDCDRLAGLDPKT